MLMKRQSLIIIILSLLLAGCGREFFPEKYYARSCVATYYAGELSASQFKPGHPIIYFKWPHSQREDGCIAYSYKSTGKDKDVYDALCAKHNDLNYNRSTRVPGSGNYPGRFAEYYHSAYWKDFVGINVVSDNDFDEAHPAGTSLNDVMGCVCRTLWPYVKGGYVHVEGETYDEDCCTIYLPTLTDLPEDVFCLVNDLNIFFTFVPESAMGTHNLTITLTADDGTIYELLTTAEYSYVWESFPSDYFIDSVQ